MIAIPIMMSSWAPLPWPIMWLGLYATVNVSAWVLLLRKNQLVEQWWSAAIGVCFGMLPLSAALWDPGTKSFWIATVIVVIAIASEVSSLPYVQVGEWRYGVGLSSLLLTVAGLIDVGVVTLAFIPVIYSIVMNADRMCDTKHKLEQAREQAERETAQAQQLAVRDELTGLANRRGISAEVDRIAAGPHTMLMIDADRFKSINDGHGYAAGDQVIQHIGRVLTRRLKAPWVVGRPGGDEFVAIAPGYRTLDDDVCAPVECRVSLYGSRASLIVGISGGVVASDTAEDSDRLMSKAGYAMRAAKRSGGGLRRFDDVLSDRFDQMLEVSAPSQDAMHSSSLVADFQIVVDDNDRIVGCEALTRWRRGDGTMVPPSEFLPVLAENGKMPMLNEVMLTHGISFAARFNGHPAAPFVAVNIGSSSLASLDLVAVVSRLLVEHNVDPARLMIEVTETEGLGAGSTWVAAATQLRALGVQLAVDDFGSGYSNLERLNVLPISHLKFDRSLVTSVSGPLGSVVRGVVQFADRTGIGIIGEGIETAAEHVAMREVGVRYFQGYFFGRPNTADAIESEILEAHEARTSSSREASTS